MKNEDQLPKAFEEYIFKRLFSEGYGVS